MKSKLTPRQIEYINKNREHLSISFMASELGVTWRAAASYIADCHKKDSPRFRRGSFQRGYHLFVSKIMSSSFFSWLPYIALLFCCVFAMAVRSDTFWLSHIRGDQGFYLSLAMKLQHQGLKGYNLREVDQISLSASQRLPQSIIEIKPAKKGTRGTLLESCYRTGSGEAYDEPLFYSTPLFPFTLMLSHALFAKHKNYRVVYKHIGKEVAFFKPKELFSSQFYAAFVPFIFGVCLVAVTFWIGRTFYGDMAGFFAAFILAVNPIAILCSYKLWSGSMVAVYLSLSGLLFFTGIKKNALWLSAGAGIAGGMAVLTKQTAGFFIFGIIYYYFWCIGRDIMNKKFGVKSVFNPHFMIYGLSFVLVISWWFYVVWQEYADPLHRPSFSRDLDKTGWTKMLDARPPSYILYTVGAAVLSPLFVFAVQPIVNLFRKPIFREETVFLVCWFLGFFIYFALTRGGKEHRYMLPAYPAVAVLAGYGLDRFRRWVNQRNIFIGDIIVFFVLMIFAAWSVSLGQNAAYENQALIQIPF